VIPHPSYFTGSTRQRRSRCLAVWEDIQLLVIRTAAFTIGENRQLPERNTVWRRQVATWDEYKCWHLLRTVERDWPARKIRP